MPVPPSQTELRPRDMMRAYQVFTEKLICGLWDDPATSSSIAAGLPGLILAYDLGSGKTGATLTAVRRLLDETMIRKVLVVAPLLVAQTVWPDEIETWEHTACLSYTLLRCEDDNPEVKAVEKVAYNQARENGAETAQARKQADAAAAAHKEVVLSRLAAEDTEIHIVNKEALPWLWKHFRRGATWPYDVTILDDVREARSGKKYVAKGKDAPKNAPAQPSRFGILAFSRKHTQKVIELCGTPTPNGVQSLWGLAYLVDQGERLGTSKTAFDLRWFDSNAYSRKIEPKDARSKDKWVWREITDKVKDIMFSLDPKDLAELPPMVDNPIRVHLPDKMMADYRAFERTLVSETYDVEAVSKGVLTLKLLQWANGSMYREDGSDIAIHDLKLTALENLREELNGHPLLVAYNFRFDLARIRKKYPKAVVLNEERDPREVVKRWSNGEIDMLIAHRASAGHGLNLQHGGRHMVQYGFTHDLELYQQFNKRLHRPGQTETVWNHQIIAVGTIDESVLPILADKAATQDQVLEATRVRILAA